LELHAYSSDGKDPKILLVVPTEALRDENWPAELALWCTEKELERVNKYLEIICYASAPMYQGNTYDLMIFDEVHHLTDRSGVLFSGNLVNYTLGLSATPPNPKADPFKHALIQQFCPVVFIYSLDQGVDDGVIADYEIVVIVEPLDNIKKNIQGGTKKAPFMTTEYAQYNYLSAIVKKTFAMADGPNKANAVKFAMLKRTRFVYDLPSKTELARVLLSKLPVDARILCFCGGIEQSRELFGENVYNSKDKKLDKLQEFKDLKIDRLGVVSAVDEGHNIPLLDIAVIVQASSSDRTIVQRIGRVLRVRDNHKGLVFILCSQGTQDESWIKKALESFDPQKITYIPSREIYTGQFFAGR
jgi:superfamily II DNA or RNA helicase